MRSVPAICGLAAFIWAIPASTQSPEWITIGTDAFAFHEEIFHDLKIEIEPPIVDDAEIFVEIIGLPNFSKINELKLGIRRSPGLKNAAAFFANGYRSIVYDPNWAAGATAEFYLVLGHEAGHHFCGHTISGFRGSRWEAELEADRFGGASIKRFEAYHNRPFFEAVMTAAAAKYPEQGSPLYPPRAMRLEAIKKGYIEGSPCGNLAPVEQSGFSPNPR